MKNDIYSVNGRIKNIIAREDISLSPVGNVLVNYYSLMLKDLYDFAESISDPCCRHALKDLLLSKENLPMLVIKVSTPEEQYETLYERVMKTRESPQFETAQAALDHFTKEYQDLGGDAFWLEAENSSILTEDHRKIMTLSRSIHMCKYLIEKENKNAALDELAEETRNLGIDFE